MEYKLPLLEFADKAKTFQLYKFVYRLPMFRQQHNLFPLLKYRLIIELYKREMLVLII